MAQIDLHTHTNESDGTDSPAELIKKASELGLKAVAITDHDTLSGLDEAEKAAKEHNIQLIRGCEISTTSPLGDFHILGLWVPRDNRQLQCFFHDARKRREKRNRVMLNKLQKLGIDISWDELIETAGNIPGRPHMALLMLKKGYVQNRAQAFAEYLGKTGKAYVPKCSPAPAYAIQALAQAGATAVLAHPMLNTYPAGLLEAEIRKMSQAGLSALEVWHSSHTLNQTRYLQDLAQKLGLGMSGGSDYHGWAKPGIDLGQGYGNLRINEKVLDNLIALRQSRGLPCEEAA